MWVVGVIGLVIAAALTAKFIQARSKIHAMTVTETLTAREIRALRDAAAAAAGPGFFEHRCEVTGTAEEGSEGSLTSELADIECVWHQHTVTRKYWKTERTHNSDGTSRYRRVEREEKVADRQSDQPFTVRDHTGTVTVYPADALEHMEKVTERFEPEDETNRRTELSFGKFSLSLPSRDREGTIGYKYEEWVLRSGRHVYVLGDVSDSTGELTFVKPELVSTKDEETLIAEYRNTRRWSLIGACVGAAAGVAFIVFDLLG